MNLDMRGLDIGSTLSPICNNDIETVNHLFFTCDMASYGSLESYARWWDLDMSIFPLFLEWITCLSSLSMSVAVRKFFI